MTMMTTKTRTTIRSSFILLVCVISLGFSALCRAEVRDFEFFSIDVPKNWTAEQQGASLVTIKSTKTKSSISLALSSKGEASIEEIAKKLYEQLKGYELEKDEDGDFSFYYEDTAGLDNFIYIVDLEDQYILASSYAENEKDDDIMAKMLASIKYKFNENEEEQEEQEEEKEETEELEKLDKDTVEKAWRTISEADDFETVPIEYEEDDAPNAWVAFEGEGQYTVHVTQSLMEALHSEEEIAGILAHELGHIKLGHYNREVLSDIGESLLGVHNDSLSELAKAVGKVDIDLTKSKFSREQETEADDYGVKLLVKAGYSPWGLYKAMKRFEKDDEGESSGFSSHPGLKERLEHLAEQAKANEVKENEDEEGESETNNHSMMGYVPSPLDMSHLSKNPPKNVTKRALASKIPPTYDMRNTGKLTPIRNQDPYGTCWSHATMAACESNYLIRTKKGNFSGELGDSKKLDLSEMYLAWFAYANTDKGKSFTTKDNSGRVKNASNMNYKDILNQGGNAFQSVAILSRIGIVLEKSMPYGKKPQNNTKPGNYTRVLRVKDATFSPPSLSSAEHDRLVKQLIMDRGPVLISYYEDSNYHNKKTNAYYKANTNTTNHMVAIVGWNDNYPRQNFGRDKPRRDGAWLIRNSWGTKWGGGGYFWMSYEQYRYTGTTFTVEPVDEKLTHYGYDDLGWVTSYNVSGKRTAYAANVFRVKDVDESLCEVGFYTTDNGAKYTISIYDYGTSKPSASNLTKGRKPIATKSGTMDIAGYHTLKFDDIPLKKDNYFAVVLKVNTPSYNFPLAVEQYSKSYAEGVIVNSGESYFSSDGEKWIDGKNFQGGANACIKAFTRLAPTTSDDEEEEEEEDYDDEDDDYDEEYDDDDWEEDYDEDYDDDEDDDWEYD